MECELANLDERNIPQAVKVWSEGWRDAHADIVPEQLVKLRTFDSFLERLNKNISNSRIALVDGGVAGMCILKKDELYQMYVSPAARGRGVAKALMLDAEDRLRKSGYSRAWLACAVGNIRAAKFYKKAGWENVGTKTVALDIPDGHFSLQVWRFEKALS